MCGICGRLNLNGHPPTENEIERMVQTLHHRGPDDQGIHIAPYIGLGQRRLSIIDLRPSACAPLTNEDRSIWLVFNGEIYNFKELRSKLTSQGHTFATSTDTEVIVHLYEEKGEACLDDLRGMFAFALWDAARKRLFCARDRLGQKPLCYARTSGALVFGSEIKAITAAPDISVAPNYQALGLYLKWQYVPSPFTAFEGIERLGPGQYFTCDCSGHLERRTYWSPPAPTPSDLPAEELQQTILGQLRKAVKLRMVSDVPLGALLSGGIDSATIVALMAQESSQPINTFSIGFEEDSHNELPWARLQAQKWNTNHHELIVQPDAAELLPRLVRHYNEPFADSSAIPTFYVSELTRRHVTVALSGDGGDETFGGYNIYAKMLRWATVDHIPASLRRIMSGLGRAALSPWPTGHNRAARLRRALSLIDAGGTRDRFLLQRQILKAAERHDLYTADFWRSMNTNERSSDPLDSFAEHSGTEPLDRLMAHDQRHYLPDCLMVKTDVASMANSLEVRCPFLDHLMVGHAWTVPAHCKMRGGRGKAVLRQAVEDLLHPDLLNKPKTGFAIPLARWFRGELAPMLRQTLLDDTSLRRGLFRPKALRRLVDEHIGAQRDWSNRLWALVCLELWFREFID